MGAESPSPSTSTTLLPFLSGGRPRRGSLASITSRNGRSGVHKDVLAQALDDIHTEASKSDGLTSFHDYDGSADRVGPKKIVSNGVSGLYNRLKQSVAGTPAKDGKTRPKSSGSRESVGATESIRSDSTSTLTATKSSARLSTSETPRSSSRAASPIVPSFSADTRQGESSMPTPRLHTVDGQPIPLLKSAKHLSSPDSRARRGISKSDPIDRVPSRITSTQEDVDRAKSAWIGDDRSESATTALARVLSGHEAPVASTAHDLEDALDDSDYLDDSDDQLIRPGSNLGDGESMLDDFVLNASGKPPDPTHQRPKLVQVGVSHLPGFDVSKASSTTDGEAVAYADSSNLHKPALEPSPNLNTGLQRRRTGHKSISKSSQSLSVSLHLKRRVLSKEFWMKDENAKGCHQCGQSFSAFRRKHHCRTCGNIFDAGCTSLVLGKPFGQQGTLRLCKTCEAWIFSGDDDDSSASSDDGDEIARSPFDKAISDHEGDDEFPGMSQGPLFSRTDLEVGTPSIGIPASRRNREAKRRSAVIEFQAHPSLARPSSSHSLTSMSRRPRSSSHRRRHSRHQIGRGLRPSVDERGPFHQDSTEDPRQSGSLPAFHSDNVIDPDLAAFLSDEGSDDDDRPNIMSAVIDGTASPGDREKLGFSMLFSSSKRKGRSRVGDKNIAASSVRGVKEDDAVLPAKQSMSNKISRNRNQSFCSTNNGRPIPRRSRSNLLTTAEGIDFPDQAPPSPVVMGKSSSPNVVSSAALCGQNTPRMELNNASYEHVRKLLSQLLRDSKISSTRAWENALMPIILQCTEYVEPAVQQGDDMDIRHYIKLKKVPGGRPGDTSYVSGVVFSKNVALKCMARSITRPRIAIVTFAIEYARHETHFMSLEPVIAQEQEYLQNLVNRIAALRPHVLLVQRHVSGSALHLLDKAGIAVAYNIKESVLAAVARVTQTTMIKSVDKLAIDPSHLGRCDSFEVKTYVFEGSRKSYIYLSGCKADLGCTIVLRGADTKVLSGIKRIAEFMCYVAYSLKLENYLMRDQFVSIPSTVAQVKAPDTLPLPAYDVQDNKDGFKYARIEQESQAKILSASPFVAFAPPFILAQLRELEQRLATYRLLRDQHAAADHDDDHEKVDMQTHFELVRPEMVNAPPSKDQPKAVREYLHAVHEAQLEKAMHTYETQERQWESFVAGDSSPFDPFSHQDIVVLYSSVSSITSAPCTGPGLLGFGFYAGYSSAEADNDEDIPLGQFVEDLCLGSSDTCKVCNKKMHDHHRQYVHGDGQLSVSIQKQPAKLRGYNNAILVWSTCRVCRHETTVTQMSDHAWKYSFAKYLEMSFWSRPLHPRAAGVCKHDIHRDFLRCFGFQDSVVRFQYDPIETYELVVPRARVTWKVEVDLTVKNEQYVNFAHRLEAFTGSIKRRLDSINVDTLDEKKSAEAQDKLVELRARAVQDHEELSQKLQRKYADSRYYELIPLNRALRSMDEKAIAWDEEFNNFERDYFPSETDIRKLATLQLRNMFLESQPPPSSIASDSDTEESTETTSFGQKVSIRRPKQDEIQSEKAQDVMSSVVQEHKASVDEQDGLELVRSNDSDLTISPQLSRRLSPLKEDEETVERDDVKHLDLAVANRSTDDVTSGPDETQSPSRPSTSEGVTSAEFATQPKPLSSGLLERIEQIRNTRVANSADPESNESKIPRLVDLKRREVSPGVAPPLLRAQSQPSHVPRRTDPASEQVVEVATPGQIASEVPSFEKRLGDRLGVGRLASKVGKVAPSLIPRSVPSKPSEHNVSSVSALAKHFEQMSREFEKERLKERRQRALRSRQARANPLASSRPIVEVYQSATDAVGERSSDHSSQDQETVDDNVARLLKDATTSDTHQEADAGDQDSSSIPRATSDVLVESPESDAAADGTQTSPRTRSRDVSDPTSDFSSVITSPTSGPDLSELSQELSIPEHRKNVWFKYLAEFWSKRSASGWANLEYPLHTNEHVFEDSDIIVREDEPSSVIALSLACADYTSKVQEFRNQPSKQPISKHCHTASQTSATQAGNTDAAGKETDIEASLLSDTGTHMKYSFAHGPVKASCKIFYAESFDALRRRCGVADRFIESMSRCLKFDSKGGKTKSLFLRTLDNRFIIKSLQEVELKAFTKFAPDYFNFMSYTLFHGVPSVIAKMFGLFQVNIRNPVTGVDFSYYLLVMENLFYDRAPTRRFDLKGSMRNRKIESTGHADEVLLDENLVESIFERPLFVREHSRKLLQASVFNDTLWLCKQNVMDYSLMAGFDDPRRQLAIGIIDCIRTYTWDKKLESWIKDRGKKKPTITSPRDYRNRFRVSMMAYALLAPSAWHRFAARMAPPKTLEGEDGEAERG